MPRLTPGDPFPLGATYDGVGTNFSVFSQVATSVDVCLFDEAGREDRHRLPEVDAYCWHGWLEGIEPGTRYGIRVDGPHDPSRGLRANPAKLLLDPYAKAVDGEVSWGQPAFPYRLGTDDTTIDRSDSAASMPKGIVVDPAFEWNGDRRLRTPWHETVIYETHVRGLTQCHPEVPPEQRGTYAGVAHPAVLEHLTRLGVTAVELMPVHQFVHDHRLAQLGLRNYWGYNSVSFLAPHNGYASRPGHRVVNEFKAMVKALHSAGMEVILDVVYNHTAEGNQLGPMLSFRGIDNPSYYRLDERDPRFYSDTTGTGNSLNMRSPHVLQLLMDSLRYWVLDMHVDGFRFDLAASLARQFHEVDRLSAFFDLIQQDPVISQVKLIAEPWDVGDGGYQVGNFPPLWSEWNGKYRDSVRDFWRGEPGTVGEFAARLTGSSDLYEATGRRPFASVNFVTCHDGFTLRDLVSYEHKHNEANGEEGRDGTDDNRSWNCGAEGDTDDPAVLALRRRQARNLLATLFLSQGVPMLCGGDEMGRTQSGNNNAYCQDSGLSWYQWAETDDDLTVWTRHLIRLRRTHPVFRRRRYFAPRQTDGRGPVPDIVWYRPDGREMTDSDWNVGYAKSLAVYLDGTTIPEPDRFGRPVVDASFLMLFNAWEHDLDVAVPKPLWPGPWAVALDTAADRPDAQDLELTEPTVRLLGHHLLLLRRGQGQINYGAN